MNDVKMLLRNARAIAIAVIVNVINVNKICNIQSKRMCQGTEQISTEQISAEQISNVRAVVVHGINLKKDMIQTSVTTKSDCPAAPTRQQHTRTEHRKDKGKSGSDSEAIELPSTVNQTAVQLPHFG